MRLFFCSVVPLLSLFGLQPKSTQNELNARALLLSAPGGRVGLQSSMSHMVEAVENSGDNKIKDVPFLRWHSAHANKQIAQQNIAQTLRVAEARKDVEASYRSISERSLHNEHTCEMPVCAPVRPDM